MTARKRIIITTFGSYGDIHPYMAIADELRSRDHNPVIATSELYREKLEAAGFEFAPVAPNLPPPQEQEPEMMEKVMNPRKGTAYLLNEMLFPHLRQGYSDLMVVVQDADLLLTHPISFAGPLVAQKTGIPWVSSVLAPASFFSSYDPPMPPFWSWMRHIDLLGPRFVRSFYGQLKKAYNSKHYEQLRKELGLPYRGNPVFEGQHSPTRILGLFSSLFAKPQPDWPPQACLTGFAFYDGGHEQPMPVELETFLNEGEPPIVFTLGSSAVWVARDFYNESIAATKALGRRAVLLVGDERNRLDVPLPPEIIAIDYAPFQSLLPRAIALVHHGGIGTTSQGLRAAVPMLIVPFAFDQPDNAKHAARLGSSRIIPRQKYKATRVAEELDVLLKTAEYAACANAVAEHLRAENGPARAADLLEEVLRSNGAPTTELREEPAYAVSN